MDKKLLEKAEKLASRNYNIIMASDTLSDGSIVYLARNPELAGCKAQGATPTQAVENLRDARIDYIYFLIEDGLEVPLPNPQAVQTGARISIDATENRDDTPQPTSIDDANDKAIQPIESHNLYEAWSIDDLTYKLD